MSLTVSFYNTSGRYYNTSGTNVEGSSRYYIGKNRRCRFNVTADQMALLNGTIDSATFYIYNASTSSSTYAGYFIACLSQSYDTALTEGNYFAQTETQSFTPSTAWHKWSFDVTSCFQYAQENWSGQAWQLWWIGTAGSSELGMNGYNNTSYDEKYAPSFTVIIDSNMTQTATPYVWTTDPNSITYPAAKMTSNSSQSCVASCSSYYSSNYYAYMAFDKGASTKPWMCKATDSSPWLQLKMPEALYGISFSITNSQNTSNPVRAPLTGSFLGSNDGSTWTEIGTYTRDNTSYGGTTTHACDNTEAYQYVRVTISSFYNGTIGTNYTSIGELVITGSNIPPTGGWRRATAYVFNGSSWNATTPYIAT